jgi:hypothetical protein
MDYSHICVLGRGRGREIGRCGMARGYIYSRGTRRRKKKADWIGEGRKRRERGQRCLLLRVGCGGDGAATLGAGEFVLRVLRTRTSRNPSGLYVLGLLLPCQRQTAGPVCFGQDYTPSVL